MDTAKKQAIAYIEANREHFCSLADYIWENPELSLKENKAAAYYCRLLEELGFTVERGLCGIETAFSGSFGSGRPKIGILAEFDALSGLSQQAGAACPQPLEEGAAGHGCGHDLLGAGSVAAAAAVKDWLEKSGAKGTVVLYGCPGEEGGSGKAYMAREGLWRDLDAALCWHPSDVNQVHSGTNNSSIQVLYKFKGIAAHAAGDPQNGRSALDAVELMNIGVQFLREHCTDDCRIHYAITDAGGISPNVVQARADVLYMVRANKVADSVKLQKRVDDIARGAALMTGTRFQRVFIDGTAELLPNYSIERLLHQNMVELGAPEYDRADLELAEALRRTYSKESVPPGLGAMFDSRIAQQVRRLTEDMERPINDFIMPLWSGEGFKAGSTDVGDVSWQTATSQIDAVCWPAGVPNHSWQVVACGKSGLAHKGMLMAGKVLAMTAIDLISNKELLQQAQAEFRERSASGYVCPIEEGAVPTII